MVKNVRYTYRQVLEEVDDLVRTSKWKHSTSQDLYQRHLVPVRNFAVRLAREYGADRQVVELSALLHDVAYIKIRDNSNHEIVGAEIARKILYGKVSEPKLDLICQCIKHHRGAKDYKRETLEEQIIACADAMCHIENCFDFIYRAGEEKSGLEEALTWLKGKMQRGWKKITLPKARKIIESRYNAVMVLLKDC